MSQSTLKWLRFATPGVIILVFHAILGRLTGLWLVSLPGNLKDALPSATVLIPAGVYYLLPFRTWANRKYFDAVSENLRSKMIRASGLSGDPVTYTWKALRGVFYHLVDNDQSLSKKASLAYFNGFLWTTCADIRVVAYTYVVIAAFFSAIGFKGSNLALILFAATAVVSYLGSARATRLHKLIGDEQIEIIQNFHRDELRKSLKEIRDRGPDEGN
jgi:hypothetical protein